MKISISKEERKYEIQDAIRVIKRYNEIASDKSLIEEAMSCMEKDLELIKGVSKNINGLVVKPIQEKIKKSVGY
jgi:hypothetical protein